FSEAQKAGGVTIERGEPLLVVHLRPFELSSGLLGHDADVRVNSAPGEPGKHVAMLRPGTDWDRWMSVRWRDDGKPEGRDYSVRVRGSRWRRALPRSGKGR